MLLIGAEGADIAGGIMDQAMPHHFILALEALAAERARTPFYRAEVWAVLRMHICVGTKYGKPYHEGSQNRAYMLT